MHFCMLSWQYEVRSNLTRSCLASRPSVTLDSAFRQVTITNKQQVQSRNNILKRKNLSTVPFHRLRCEDCWQSWGGRHLGSAPTSPLQLLASPPHAHCCYNSSCSYTHRSMFLTQSIRNTCHRASRHVKGPERSIENHPVSYLAHQSMCLKNRRSCEHSQFQTSRILAVALLALFRSSFLAL